MELVRRGVETTPAVGIELLLTVAEEQGLRGAKAFDIGEAARADRLRPRPRRAGRRGDHRDADPAEDPRRLPRGRGARRGAARGRLERDRGRRGGDRADGASGASTRGRPRTSGSSRGGTSGNVVPGHCGIHAEARSIDAARAAEVAGQISDACAWGASEYGCDVDVRIEELFRGYKVPSGSTALGLAEESLRAIGVEPRREAIGGGSDANVFRLAGFDSVLLANGPDARPHRRRARRRRRPRPDARGLRGHPGAGVSGERAARPAARGRRLGRPAEVEVDGERAARLGRRGPAGGDARGRRGRRQRRGPRPRARVGRLRRRPREPDPRPRRRGGGRRPRDEAELHLAPAPGRAGRGGASDVELGRKAA